MADEKVVSTSIAPDFAALDDKAASDAANKLIADRRTLEQNLTTQLDAVKTPDNRKVLLIYTLGKLRSRWAVASLIKVIDFKAPFMDPKFDVARWGSHPAVDALAGIGDPAVIGIVDTLSTEKDDARVRLMVMVIYRVEGAKPGQARLETALAKAHDDTAKQNLQNALSAYRELAVKFDK